jgi:hypothetical protein
MHLRTRNSVEVILMMLVIFHLTSRQLLIEQDPRECRRNHGSTLKGTVTRVDRVIGPKLFLTDRNARSPSARAIEFPDAPKLVNGDSPDSPTDFSNSPASSPDPFNELVCLYRFPQSNQSFFGGDSGSPLPDRHSFLDHPNSPLLVVGSSDLTSHCPFVSSFSNLDDADEVFNVSFLQTLELLVGKVFEPELSAFEIGFV